MPEQQPLSQRLKRGEAWLALQGDTSSLQQLRTDIALFGSGFRSGSPKTLTEEEALIETLGRLRRVVIAPYQASLQGAFQQINRSPYLAAHESFMSYEVVLGSSNPDRHTLVSMNWMSGYDFWDLITPILIYRGLFGKHIPHLSLDTNFCEIRKDTPDDPARKPIFVDTGLLWGKEVWFGKDVPKDYDYFATLFFGYFDRKINSVFAHFPDQEVALRYFINDKKGNFEVYEYKKSPSSDRAFVVTKTREYRLFKDGFFRRRGAKRTDPTVEQEIIQVLDRLPFRTRTQS